MTISLEKVELENIRSHKNLVFTPETEGVTAISGPNGTGKSTIVDSISWALYGTKPKGVSKTVDLARKGSTPGKDTVAARVFLKIDSERILVERKIVSKGGAVECNVWRLEGDADKGTSSNLLAGPAVSHTEKTIRKLLGMNAKGFLAAVLVQQKQVDELITAGPKDRTEVIERLTGIDSITNAYKQAREEYNSLRKLLGATVEVEGPERLKKELEQISCEVETLRGKRDKTLQEIKDNDEELSEKKNAFQVQETNRQKTRTLREEITKLSAVLEEVQENLSEALKEKEEAKLSLGDRKADDLPTLREELRKIEHELDKQRAELAVCSNEAKNSKKIIDRNLRLIEKSKTSSADEAIEKFEALSLSLKEAEETAREAAKAKASANSLIKSFEKAIKVLSEGACPTCLQKVPDSTAAIGELEEQIKALRPKDIDYQEPVARLSKKVNAYSMVVDAFKENESLEFEVKELEQKTSRLKADVTSSEKSEEIARKNYDRASRNSELLARYKKISEKAKELTLKKNDLIGRVEDDKAGLKEIKVMTDKSFDLLKEKVAFLEDKVSKQRLKSVELNGELNLLEEKSKNLEKDIALAEQAEKEYAELLKNVETASSNSALLEEFRVNRINTSIPLIESYASDLLSRFTEGGFAGLKLDANFNAKAVLPDGTLRPIGLLSGGELSAASIALRLAISMLLNTDSSNGLIILDEVLVSQDRDRAEIILNTISDVCKGQVVIIAHNDSIDGIADKVVSLGS